MVSFFGWGTTDEVTDVFVASDGSTFVAGVTGSPSAYDPFIAKVNASRASVDFATRLGGYGQDVRLALGNNGRVWLAGQINIPYLPAGAGSFDSTFNGGSYDLFVAEFNANTGAYLASTYLGGNDSERLGGITISAAGNPVVCGDTESGDFPTTAGALQRTMNGWADMTVTELNQSLDTLVASTFLGGDGPDYCKGIGLGPSGRIYAGGQGSANFPTTNGTFMPQVPMPGGIPVAAALNASLGAVDIGSFMGQRTGAILGFCIDAAANAYVVEWVFNGSSHYVDPPIDLYTGTQDLIVTKLNANLTQQVYATTFGGNSLEWMDRLRADENGFAFIAGTTYSSDFPMANAYNTTEGWPAAYITVLDADGSKLLFSSFLGGNDTHGEVTVAPDGDWGLVAGGSVWAGSFPATPNALMPTYQGSGDGFLAWLPFYQPPNPAFTVTPREGNVTETFLFDASSSTDRVDAPAALQVRWDFDGDGNWDTDWLSIGVVHGYTYYALGNFTARAEVRNSFGAVALATRSVTVVGVPPVPALTISPNRVRTGEPFVLNASASIDAASPGWPLEFRWDVNGDGQWDSAWDTSPTRSASLLTVGDFTLTVQARGRYGDLATATAALTVYDDAPVPVVAVTPPSGTVQTNFGLDVSASHDWEDPFDQLLFRVDWESDGAFDEPWAGATAHSPSGPAWQHAYARPGLYTVTLEVKDSAGNTASTTRVATVEDTLPVAFLFMAPPTGGVGTVFTADASDTRDLETNLQDLRFSFDWDGDGIAETGWLSEPRSSSPFTAPGTHRVVVWVQDEGGHVVEANATATVVDGPPIAALGATPSRGNITTAFALDASGSSDRETAFDSLMFRFDFDADGRWDTDWSSAPNASLTYAQPGNYSAFVEVRDLAGFSSTARAQLRVLDERPRAALTAGFRGEGCPAACLAPPTVWLDAGNSSDLETSASELLYRFDFEGDGNWDTAWSHATHVEFSYTTPGQFDPVVEVDDGHHPPVTASLSLDPWDLLHAQPPPNPTPPAHTPEGTVDIAPGSPLGMLLLLALVCAAALVVITRRKRMAERP